MSPLLLPAILAAVGAAIAPLSAPHAPTGAWMQYTTPEDAGFSSTALDSVRRLTDSVRSGAVMAVYRDRVLVAWGDVAREFQAHPVRKSMLSALYGIAVAEGKINLRVVEGVSVRFEPQTGPVTGLTVSMGGRTMRARKR
jgi:hypothetical protein